MSAVRVRLSPARELSGYYDSDSTEFCQFGSSIYDFTSELNLKAIFRPGRFWDGYIKNIFYFKLFRIFLNLQKELNSVMEW
uniref:Uncharacterized protein n=1 Tax=Aegilops tauschii subsp. strangulata TaxID=200361 RepID=A0A453E9I1_AEGTS